MRGLARRGGRPTNRERAEREGPQGALLRALSHETRRRIVLMLAQGPLPVHAIAEAFDVSRPMVSKHLRALVEAGLAEGQLVGRERRYRLLETPAARMAVALSRADEEYAAALERLRERLGP
jgi:DNA-binding transcriptional ArsR family regulator